MSNGEDAEQRRLSVVDRIRKHSELLSNDNGHVTLISKDKSSDRILLDVINYADETNSLTLSRNKFERKLQLSSMENSVESRVDAPDNTNQCFVRVYQI